MGADFASVSSVPKVTIDLGTLNIKYIQLDTLARPSRPSNVAKPGTLYPPNQCILDIELLAPHAACRHGIIERPLPCAALA